jgi:hypothetical protein
VRPEDELARRVVAYVDTQVPPEHRQIVARTVCMTLATLMADPAFTNELEVVKQLREENQWLRANYQILKGMMDKVGVKRPAKRGGSKKPPGTSATPRKRAAGSSTNRGRAASRTPNSSFRQGFEEMRG